MPIFFQKPENALKRAGEFIDVGKQQRALDALYDAIKSKKHRQWTKTHEQIMEKYLELCVELKKSHIAKEGLYQYKNISQTVNPKSLEDVVRKYLKLAEDKTEAAREESHQAVVDVDDLDVIQTPESLLLSAVSGEDQQDRSDRAILTPWVKFLWESYRQCLDLLRNDSSVERLYQDIAQQAFKFCLKYARKTEFRKLCDNLRTHLGHIHKHQHKQRAINLNNPDSQAMHLETRLCQLDHAIQMELWQEAFKAVEDIHGLIQLSKKAIKPSLMATYYTKLALVFWKSGNHMFHAATLHRLYVLTREQRKNLTQEELAKLSSRVLCATLAIPIPASRSRIDALMKMDESTLEKKKRLSNLLSLKEPPTRVALVKDLVKHGVVQCVHAELHDLYRWLEEEFHPLKLAERTAAPVAFMAEKKDLKQYVPAIQDITIMRLIKQISQVYESIEIARFARLAPFAERFRLERVIVDAAKNLELQVRIDHNNESLTFGTDLGVAQKEDTPEGPFVQSMPSEQIRSQLAHMANALNQAVRIVRPVDNKRDELRAHICQSYRQVARKEHTRILQRRQIIEDRKEELENINTAREQEEMALLEEQRRKQYEAEMARLEREAEERERQKRLQEHQEVQKKVARERLDQLRSTDLGKTAFQGITEEEIAQMDVDDIMAKQVEQLEKEKRELQEKLKGQEKKIDYFERAKRVEEVPLLEEQGKRDAEARREQYNEQQADRIAEAKREREMAVKQRDRLSRMTEDKDEFINKLKSARMSVFKEKLAEFEKKLKEERRVRLEERKTKRAEERRNKYYKEKEEEEQRRKDEEAKRLREEEERKKREEKEAEEAEYMERMRKLQEIEDRKRQRELEIEERQRKDAEERRQRADEAKRGGDRRDDRRDARRDDDDSSWRRRGDDQSADKPGAGRDGGAWRPAAREGAGGGGGGWRERERAKEESWSRPGEGKEERGWRRDERRDDRSDDRRDDRRDGGRDDWRRDRRDDDRRDDRRGWRGDDRDKRGGDEGGRDDWRRRDADRDGGGGGGWRGARDDRGPRDDRRDDRGGGGGGGGWRDRERDRDAGGGGGGWRDRAAAPREDRDRRGMPRDIRLDEERGFSRDVRRDDRPAPRGGDDRGPPRDRDGGGAWRRGGGGGGGGERDGGGAWRRGGDRSDRSDDRPPPSRASDRGGDRGGDRGDDWRREKRAPPAPAADREPARKTEEDDGWTTVKR